MLNLKERNIHKSTLTNTGADHSYQHPHPLFIIMHLGSKSAWNGNQYILKESISNHIMFATKVSDIFWHTPIIRQSVNHKKENLLNNSQTAENLMTSSNGNIFRVTGPLCGEFTGHRWIPSQGPVTRSFDVFFDLRLNKRLSKQSRRWWFKTPSRSLWCKCNDYIKKQ